MYFFLAVKAVKMADPAAASRLEEYRGSSNWEGLIPAVGGPGREWDEGFRAFLLK